MEKIHVDIVRETYSSLTRDFLGQNVVKMVEQNERAEIHMPKKVL